ncbi:MAG: type II toxin-antitoxin system RelE/ParE family toxin [Desulfobacterales bacterium]|nr:type II toxin-antitoxin system RelE/ParE family toxin [Desulfobacterales bacterium]
MKVLYSKRFSKDLDHIATGRKIKKRLLQLINQIKQIESLAELENVRKIQGYDEYFRIRLGDYRLGVKITDNGLEMLRFLHRKDIYRRFP